MAPRPPSIVDAANSVFDSIHAQRVKSLQRIEQNGFAIQGWLKEALDNQMHQVMEKKGDENKEPAKKKQKSETGLDQDLIDYIYSLKVPELREELRERGLDANGVKKVLQGRLVEAFEFERGQQESGSVAQSDNGNVQAYSTEMDKEELEFKESEEKLEPAPMEIEETAPSALVNNMSLNEKEEIQLMEVEETTKVEEKIELKAVESVAQPRSRSPLQQIRSGVKSALRALSPTKQKSQSAVSSMVEKFESSKKEKAYKEEQTVSSISSNDESQTKAAEAKAPLDAPSQSRLMTGPARVITATGTVASKPGGNGPIVSKSVRAAQEARRAKLAEIRSKSKPIVSSTASISSVPSLSKFKTFASESAKSQTKDGKRNLLAAQMREKAAKLQGDHSKYLHHATEQLKENSPNKVPGQLSSSSLYSGFSKSNSALSEVTNSTNKDLTSPNPKPASPLMSPMDTYELSDREQSDSESEDEQYSKPKKRIPQWAQKSNLMPALEHQFTRGNHDPDKIFGEVHTCDLQAIFDQKKARYQRRTSSGNWTQDRATAAEKLAYKRSQGYGGEE